MRRIQNAGRRRTTRGRGRPRRVVRGRRGRRNPQIRGIVEGAIWAGAGNIASNLIAGFVPINVTGIAAIGVKVAIAYVTGLGFERLTNPQNASLAAIGALTGAVQDALHLALGTVQGVIGKTPPIVIDPNTGVAGYLGEFGDIAPFPADLERYALNDITASPDYAQ